MIAGASFLQNAFTLQLHFPQSPTKRNRSPKALSSSSSSYIPFLNHQCHHSHSLLPFRHLSPFLRFSKSPSFSKVIRGVMLEPESEDSDFLPVELCYTHTLPPALTLEHGLLGIKHEIEKLKSNPPSSKSGLLRFQVSVPQSTKALGLLCSQSQLDGLCPQFYLSKQNLEKPILDLHAFSDVHGISGVGAAVHFVGSSRTFTKWSLIKRYLSVDSPLIRAYGLLDIDFDLKSSSLKRQTGSFYFFIPQIELDEYDGVTLLAAMFAWNCSSTFNFEKAVHSFELSFHQVLRGFSFPKDICCNISINTAGMKPDMMEETNVKMLLIDAHSFTRNNKGADNLQVEVDSSFNQFFFKFSPTIALANDMLDNPSETRCLLKNSANINAVWASLIIEECSRLGLQYIFIAPGSRSSPLAIAAVTHPRTRCISCYDERSLAFHAVGYARGSRKPAVIITSSGTAVSNLLPAVVEASQDFIPLLLLTADRPPELQDAGANQSINQVNHFSSFVRFFFNLPSPTDDIPLRMVLTTIDTAVYRATHAPDGPVHINCPFREPLGDTPSEWKTSCLKGLEFWMSSAEPFTTYIRMEHSHACDKIHGKINDVIELIRSAKMGFLLIGSLLLDDDMWAALVLAKHLSWPIVADILSGLRLRKAFSRFPEIKNEFLFLDHFDQVLFSDSVKDWAKADVVVQIGSRITSKRICQMLEVCSPHSYIMVDKHPQRFDPSHIITHRIQSTVTEFASALIEVQFPKINSKWSYFLQALNTVVEWEMSFQIHSEHSLTEPLVAQVISESLPVDAAFFFGNSMVIRDANMFGHGWVKPRTSLTRTMPSLELDCLGIQAAGNRGASGIDGLLSTAVGFAIGCNKRVFCVIGDISFLHDTNGLALMKQREWRKPMIVLVINNHGGAIFSLLPIADKIKPSILSQYFYTSHDISIGKLCKAHSVNHILVRTKVELQHALSVSQQAQSDFLIEVESSIEDNATFHRILGKYACRAADHTLKILSRLMTHVNTSSNFQPCRIHRIEYSLYRIELSAPLTTFPSNKNQSRFYREGFILALALEDGCIGFGEVAPLSIQKENVLDVEQQLRFLVHVIQGAQMSSLLPLLRGAFSSWIWSSLGIPPHSIFPSVRCGVEMAILNAVAASQGYSLSNLLAHHQCSNQGSQLTAVEQIGKSSSSIQICALLDSCGTPMEVANVAEKLVKKGFNSIKLKVGRRGNPLEDAAVVQEIRKKIGHQIKLRVDANRNWTYKQAIEFGSGVELCKLQYIEEPVQLEDDIIRFCEETGLPVALDETISDIQGDPLSRLAKFMHTGIVALVIKPSVIGGFEKAASVAKWAQKRGKMVIVSAAFESSLSLAAYVQFSYYLEQENIEICRMMNKEPNKPVAHGLGTYSWLKEDVSTEPLRVSFPPDSKVVEASVEDAARLLNGFNVNNGAIQKSYVGEEVRRYQVTLYRSGFSYSINVQELGPNTHDHVLVFFHGFLGTSEDWTSIMMAISTSVRCISIDLPGHGESKIEQNNNEGKEEPNLSIEVIADLFCELICKITPAKVVLLGYSMGARIALYMALRCNKQIDGAVIVSGSPGLKDVRERRTRMVQDDARAHFLETKGLHSFLDTWYSGNLWMSLRAHPQFNKIISSRLQHKDVYFLAKSLSDLSIGKQPSLWEDLKECTTPLSFVCGEMDEKFKEIAKQMLFEVSDGSVKGDDHNHKIHEMIEVPDCGHAVHLENPLYLIKAIRKFLTRLNKSTSMRSASSSTSL